MAKKTKRFTRAFVELSGHRAEILKVYESTKGELHIFPKHAPFFATDGHNIRNTEIWRSKYTLHNSPNSSGNTISFDEDRGLEQFEYKAFWKCKDHRFLAWLYTQRFSDISHNNWRMKPNPNDSLWHLGTFDEWNTSLLASVFVCDNEISDAIDALGDVVKIQRFRRYAVVIVPYIFTYVRWSEGDVARAFTSSPTLDGGKLVPSMVPTPADPILPDLLLTFVGKTNLQLVDRMKARLFESFKNFAEDDNLKNRIYVAKTGRDLRPLH